MGAGNRREEGDKNGGEKLSRTEESENIDVVEGRRGKVPGNRGLTICEREHRSGDNSSPTQSSGAK